MNGFMAIVSIEFNVAIWLLFRLCLVGKTNGIKILQIFFLLYDYKLLLKQNLFTINTMADFVRDVEISHP